MTTRIVSFPLPKAARRLLSRAKLLRLDVRVVASDVAGNGSTLPLRLGLRSPLAAREVH